MGTLIEIVPLMTQSAEQKTKAHTAPVGFCSPIGILSQTVDTQTSLVNVTAYRL